MENTDIPEDSDLMVGYECLASGKHFSKLGYDVTSTLVDDMVSRPAVRDNYASPDTPDWAVRTKLMRPYTDEIVGKGTLDAFMTGSYARAQASVNRIVSMAKSVGIDPAMAFGSPGNRRAYARAIENCKYL